MQLIYSDRKQIMVVWNQGWEGLKGRITKGHEETCKNNQYACYFDHGDGFMGYRQYVKTHQVAWFKYV